MKHLVSFDVHLTKNQMKKLAQHKPVRIKNEHIGIGHTLQLKPAKVKSLEIAKKKGIGKQLQLTTEEIEGSGIFDKIKKGFQKVGKEISKGYKEHVKDTPVGQVIRKGVKEGVSKAIKALPAITSSALSVVPGGQALAPVVSSVLERVADNYADKAGDQLVKKTGLGLHPETKAMIERISKNMRAGRGIKSDIRKAYHSSRDYLGSGIRSDLKKAGHYLGSGIDSEDEEMGVHTFKAIKKGILDFNHPAMHPPPPMKDMSGSGMYKHHPHQRGGSFLPPGY